MQRRRLTRAAPGVYRQTGETIMHVMAGIEPILCERASGLDIEALRESYDGQGELVVLERFLPRGVLDRWEHELDALLPRVHRNYLPDHKKGGSAGYETLSELAPSMTAVYHSPALQQLLRSITRAPLRECPPLDPHRCALYAYTEAGDHMGWHYDTSYYRDRRWTLLVGLRDRSAARLLCRLHTRDPGRVVTQVELRVSPGTLVLFDGEKVHHAVTPIGPGESRFIVSMQYVITGEMSPFKRFVSNMKDAVAYFGFREVLLGGKKR